MARSGYITDVNAITIEGECVRIELIGDLGTVILRASVHTLVKGMELGKRAVAERLAAEIVPLPHD